MSWTGNEKCHGSLRSENTSVCLDTSEHDLTRLQYHLSHVPKEWENQPLSSHAGNMLSPTPRFFSGGTFPLTKEKHRKSMTGKKKRYLQEILWFYPAFHINFQGNRWWDGHPSNFAPQVRPQNLCLTGRSGESSERVAARRRTRFQVLKMWVYTPKRQF